MKLTISSSFDMSLRSSSKIEVLSKEMPYIFSGNKKNKTKGKFISS
jgi:hypothetical protein